MGLLGQPVALHDIRDIDAYVSAAVVGLHLNLNWCAREELEAEGLLIACELAKAYRPGRAAFSTFLGNRLSGRLLDAWHRQHRGEHIRRGNQDGHRVWDYRTIASLDGLATRPMFTEAGLRPMCDFAATQSEAQAARAESRQARSRRRELLNERGVLIARLPAV